MDTSSFALEVPDDESHQPYDPGDYPHRRGRQGGGTKYQPPYTITSAIVNLVAEIGETIGRYTVLAEQNLTPRLRRENRIRTIQASLAIENNPLTLEQVTAVIEGKRVLGYPREIQEVRPTRPWRTGTPVSRRICWRRTSC